MALMPNRENILKAHLLKVSMICHCPARTKSAAADDSRYRLDAMARIRDDVIFYAAFEGAKFYLCAADEAFMTILLSIIVA